MITWHLPSWSLQIFKTLYPCVHIYADFGRAVEESLFLIINHLYVHNLYEFQEMIEGSCSKINLLSFTSFTPQKEGEKNTL